LDEPTLLGDAFQTARVLLGFGRVGRNPGTSRISTTMEKVNQLVKVLAPVKVVVICPVQSVQMGVDNVALVFGKTRAEEFAEVMQASTSTQ
jgi:hypothetical protein